MSNSNYKVEEIARQDRYRRTFRKNPIFLDDFKRKDNETGRVYSHLFTIPRDERRLARFAVALGLNHTVVQAGRFPHIDLSEKLRERAVLKGAIEITYDDASILIRGVLEAEATGDELSGSARDLFAYYTAPPEKELSNGRLK